MPLANDTAHRSFTSKNGDKEHFIFITAPGNLSFDEQVSYIHERHTEAMKTLSLKPASTIFKRFFTSDAVNLAQKLYRSPLFSDSRANPIAFSLVQQTPLPFSRIALFAYHIDCPDTLLKERVSPHHVIVEKNDIRHLWSTQMCCGFITPQTQEELQTREIFNELCNTLRKYGAELKTHCIRTWTFIKNIDVLYEGMLKSRREIYQREDLKDHFITSTAIEGCCDHPYDYLSMDAYSILNHDKIDVSFLNDLNFMCAAKDYNVAFERGTKVAYADRAHVYVSGTASIDHLGQTMHQGDVMKQLDRTLDNVESVLKAGSAAFADMMYMIVYLRDANDYERVSAVLRARFPDTPLMFAHAPICRSEWLVEIECMAIIANDSPKLRKF